MDAIVKIIRLLMAIAFCGYFQLTSAMSIDSKDSIAQIALKGGVKFGFAVNYNGLKNVDEYRYTVKKNATSIVPDNALKWKSIQPIRNQFNFEQSDYILNFALLNNMQLRGHTLVWHGGTPDYVKSEKDPEKLELMLRQHITEVVGRYKGKIKSWDVVNEVIHIPDGQPNGLRNSYWYQVLGERYIDIAFDAAHKADSNATLVYNEWGTEYDRNYSIAKREAVIALIKRLQARNIPISGFGIQAHITTNGANYIGDDLTDFIDELRGLGLKVYVTELDVKQSQSTPPSLKNYTAAEAYQKFLNYVLKNDGVDSVLVWGVLNKNTPRVSTEAPLYLFDKSIGCNSSCSAVKESFKQATKE